MEPVTHAKEEGAGPVGVETALPGLQHKEGQALLPHKEQALVLFGLGKEFLMRHRVGDEPE